MAGALARFGDPGALAGCFRKVYRSQYLLFYGLKLGASLLASGLAALVIQAAANLRPVAGAETWHLAPAFPKTALLSVAMALGAVAVWEGLRRPLQWGRGVLSTVLYVLVSLLVQAALGRGLGTFVAAVALVAIGYATSRLKMRPAGLLAAYLAFSLTLYTVHLAVPASRIGPFDALAVGAALAAVWSASLAILSGVDRAFLGLMEKT
jgi:hypothetical protein